MRGEKAFCARAILRLTVYPLIIFGDFIKNKNLRGLAAGCTRFLTVTLPSITLWLRRHGASLMAESVCYLRYAFMILLLNPLLKSGWPSV